MRNCTILGTAPKKHLLTQIQMTHRQQQSEVLRIRFVPTCFVAVALVISISLSAERTTADEPLAGTKRLDWEEASLPERVMDVAHLYIDRKIAAAAKERLQYWPTNDADAGAWKKSVEANRDHLRTIIGAVDERLPPRVEFFGDTPESSIIVTFDGFRVAQVRWPVVEGVYGEGLLIIPRERAIAAAVVLPDADQTPEEFLALAGDVAQAPTMIRQLIANNVEVLVPALISRDKLETDDTRLLRSDQTRREWLYRQAFHMGRHILGYEVQKVLAAVDWIKLRHQQPMHSVGVAGYGEGALIAFYAAALDTRIDATIVSGYFDSRENVWSEPIYRNVWSLLKRFGDAEIASLVVPRTLIIEYTESPTITAHKGDWKTPPFERVAEEVARIRVPPNSDRPRFVHGEDGAAVDAFSVESSSEFLRSLGVGTPKDSITLARVNRLTTSLADRQQAMVQQIEDHVQKLVRRSEHVRDRFMLYDLMPELNNSKWSTEKQHPIHDPQKFIKGTSEFRRRFHEEAIGRFDDPLLPFNARSRIVAETEHWTAYDVVLDVFDELIAWGVLVVPKDLKAGEQRPVVVCQHGRQGIPRDTLDNHQTAYNDFAAKLAERGFITFAPHNLYYGEERYRWLDRKANSIGCTLFSFIVAQHDQILRWLDSQPFVDGDRIAFYGLSYGGETAVRVPTILEKYCLSICSGDFNQWTRKVAATDQPFSFMRTIEWEMPYWNLGHTFDYAEMTYLMLPRPFMVERGHLDRVGRDRWVAHEFAKVRWLYAQLGLADRVDIEFFQGGHSINGEGSFAFLHKHLDWPEPGEPKGDLNSGRP